MPHFVSSLIALELLATNRTHQASLALMSKTCQLKHVQHIPSWQLLRITSAAASRTWVQPVSKHVSVTSSSGESAIDAMASPSAAIQINQSINQQQRACEYDTEAFAACKLAHIHQNEMLANICNSTAWVDWCIWRSDSSWLSVNCFCKNSCSSCRA
jgi:hypothetical protein